MIVRIDRLSFHARVLVAAVIPAVLIAVALAWYFTLNRVADWDKALYERGLMIARQLAPASQYGAFSGNAVQLSALVNSAKAEADVDAVVILDARGQQLAGAGAAIAFARPPEFPTTAALLVADTEHYLFVAPIAFMPSGVDDVFEAASGGSGDRAKQPIGLVVVQMGRDRLERLKNELAASAALITFAGLLVAGWLARWLSRGAARPVMELAGTVAEIARGNLDVRAAIGASGSLKILEQGVNEMAHALTHARDSLELRVHQATTELQAQKEVAESANRTKTRFLAAASHDLRQPLQALGLFANALRRHAREEAAETLVDRIERAIESLENVLDALLDISRLDAGVVEPRPVAFPVAEMFARLEETFADGARSHGLTLRFMATTAWAYSDPLLLERIAANLIGNALRYTTDGGVLVGCRRQGDDELRFEVWDTGRGIAAEDLDQIFGEFVQVGAPQAGRDKGLGLGLSIVDRLARLLGHRLSVRSRPGHGSVFGVSLPRGRADVGAPVRPASMGSSDALPGRCIAVIEDDPEIRAGLVGFLSSFGARVEAAADDATLIRSLGASGRHPDAVITDYRLAHDLTGLEAAGRLLGLYGSELPVILVTGESDPEVIARLVHSGFPILHKPVRPEHLLSALATALGHQAVSCGAVRAA